MVDLEAYFARVGYAGESRPTLETLRTLHRLHPAAIPFESLDVWLGRPIRLEAAAVDAKLIHGGRGGYCFEQNSLLLRVLQAIGFEAEPLIARSRWNRAPNLLQARTHMALRVRLQEEWWLADVGFGGCMLTTPLRLADRAPQETAFEPRRLAPHGDDLRLEVLIGDDWRGVCDLVPAPQTLADMECANWFISTHPSSVFHKHIVVTRTLIDARYVLTDNQLAIRRPGRPTELRVLDARALERSLVEDFGLRPQPAWRPMIQAIASG